MAAIEDLRRVLGETSRLVDNISDDQWRSETPCNDWDVATVVRHLRGGNARFAAAVRGQSPPGAQVDLEPERLPEAFRQTAQDLLAAFSEPGGMERMVDAPMGRVPAAAALELRITENATHGWDLARATGQQARYDPAVIEQALAFAVERLGRIPPDRSPFKPPQDVSPDAPVLDRLAAQLGRNP